LAEARKLGFAMDTQARPLLLLVFLLLPACGSTTTAARAPESAPATVSLPPPEPASAEPSAPEAPRPPPPAKDAAAPMLGRTKEEAINVCQPMGQRAYLSRLRCPDGQPPRFGRRGNVGARNERKGSVTDEDLIRQMDMSRILGPGEIDYHVIDLYEVQCSDTTHEIFMDMYHCADPKTNKPPSGFTLAPE
ncbi:MAG: hypothetical protein L6Q76_35610, partial [Polyangiaceae bacterium]|nr:hypothetical protein [Polyangiaceae bacterium]